MLKYLHLAIGFCLALVCIPEHHQTNSTLKQDIVFQLYSLLQKGPHCMGCFSLPFHEVYCALYCHMYCYKNNFCQCYSTASSSDSNFTYSLRWTPKAREKYFFSLIVLFTTMTRWVEVLFLHHKLQENSSSLLNTVRMSHVFTRRNPLQETQVHGYHAAGNHSLGTTQLTDSNKD